MKILFVGESWKGSSARSLREGLAMQSGLDIDEVAEDHYFPKYKSFGLRAVSRLAKRLQVVEFEDELAARLAKRPQALVVYKGVNIDKRVVDAAAEAGVLTVNIFPDYSPHAYGRKLRNAIGAYHLVISTKPFHPAQWRSTYGYSNACVFVPHGYDPAIHYWSDVSTAHDIDVLLVSTWRPEYQALMKSLFDELCDSDTKVCVAGPGWTSQRDVFPSWTLLNGVHGRAYGELLRRARIVVAPVNTRVVVDNVVQPGDEDTTRTYELAAAGCFFLHRRTPFVQSLYDEQSEVPMWSSPKELAGLIRKFLPLNDVRSEMAARAQKRAVPAYSIPLRAKAILRHITDVRELVEGRQRNS